MALEIVEMLFLERMDWPFMGKANGSLPYDVRAGHLHVLVPGLLQEVSHAGL